MKNNEGTAWKVQQTPEPEYRWLIEPRPRSCTAASMAREKEAHGKILATAMDFAGSLCCYI